MEQPRECFPDGKLYKEGNSILICKNGKLEFYKYCEWGVTTDENGNFVCAKKPGAGDKTFLKDCNVVCEDPDGCICSRNCVKEEIKQGENCGGEKQGSKKFSLWWLILVGGLIGGVFSLLNPIPNKKVMIAKTIFFIILGLIIGFAVAYVIKLIIIAITNISNLLSV